MKLKTLLLLVLSLIFLTNLGIYGTHAETKNGEDYFWFEPGHYIKYSTNEEIVYQHTINDGIFLTYNNLAGKWGNALFGGVRDNLIIINGGFPSGNEANYWFLFSIPITFNDGDMWKNGAGLRVDYIGEWEVNGEVYSNCIKISINNLDSAQEYTRGEGEVYLAKNIGIIEWNFRKTNGVVYNPKLVEWGELPPINVSGVITLDGKYPAVGYHIGLSNRHRNDASNQITDEYGRFSLIGYGHKLILRYFPIDEGDPNYGDYTFHEIFDVEQDITELTLSMGYPPLPTEIDIDDVYFERERVDIGSEQFICLHLSWGFDGTDASEIEVIINGTKYYTNNTGWLSFPSIRNTIGTSDYVISSVSNCDDYNIKAFLHSPIWDTIIIPEDKIIRIQKGNILPVSFAFYAYDKLPFSGSLFLNDTITNKPIGRYRYQITGLTDERYGLSNFTSNVFDVIIDEISFNLILTDNRVDTGQNPEIATSGVYKYDNESFRGSIRLSEPDSDLVGEKVYKVESIQDNQYGFTSFETNEVSCIWDKLQITESGTTNSTTLLGETEIVWFKAVYEYDSEIFDSTKGSLKIAERTAGWNGAMEYWEISVIHDEEIIEEYSVTSLVDEQYGLTVLNHEASPVIIKWEAQTVEEADSSLQQGIPGYPLYSIMLAVGFYLLSARRYKLIK